jgi:hypothetical protein
MFSRDPRGSCGRAVPLWMLVALIGMGCPTRDSYPGGTGGGAGAASAGSGGQATAGHSGIGGIGGQAGTAGAIAGAPGPGGAEGAAGLGGAGAGGAAGAAGSAAGAAGSAAGAGAGGGAGAAGRVGGAGGSAGANGGAGGRPDAGCAVVTGVLDFEDLAFSGVLQALPTPYLRDGFALINSTRSLKAVGSESVQYLNTTAVIADPGSTTTLARTDGSPFALVKIDLSAYDDGHPGIVYYFAGTTVAGGTVTTMISLLTSGRAFVTYTLPESFADVTSVSWTMNNADTEQYFDNVAYSFCRGGG